MQTQKFTELFTRRQRDQALVMKHGRFLLEERDATDKRNTADGGRGGAGKEVQQSSIRPGGAVPVNCITHPCFPLCFRERLFASEFVV